MAKSQEWRWGKLSKMSQFSLEIGEHHTGKRMESVRYSWCHLCFCLNSLVVCDKYLMKARKRSYLRDFIGFIRDKTNFVINHLFSKGAIDQDNANKFIKNNFLKKRLSSYAVKSRKEEGDGQQIKKTGIIP